MEEELLKRMQQWVEDGFEIYIEITETTNNEKMRKSVGSIKDHAKKLNDDEKFRFKAEVMGRFLIGLNEKA